MNGDTYHKINYKSFIKKFFYDKSDLQIVVFQKNNIKDYGSINIDGNSNIISITAKGENTYVDSGSYIFKKDLLKFIPINTFNSMNNDFLFDLLDRKAFKIKSYISKKDFIDIGTPTRLHQAKNVIK